MSIQIKVKKVQPMATIMEYKTAGAMCFDFALIEDVTFMPYEVKKIRTGLAFEFPEGYGMNVYPRSSMGLNTPLRMANGTGKIDSDYRGEVCGIFENTSDKEYHCKAGDRLMQGEIVKVLRAQFEEVDELGSTVRGIGGFGSTGR